MTCSMVSWELLPLRAAPLSRKNWSRAWLSCIILAVLKLLILITD